MKKIFNWVFAATIICGASVFTSCSNDTSDNPAQEQAKKNRKEFIEHTRQNLKDMAENLTFDMWDYANELNRYINQYVFLNDEFDKTLFAMLQKELMASVQPVDEGSELAQMGYKQQAFIDLSKMKLRFTENDTNDGWSVEPIDDGFEIILNGWNTTTYQPDPNVQKYKLAINFSGDTFMQLNHNASWGTGIGVVMLMPSEVSFSISSGFNGVWLENYSGTFKNTFESRTESKYLSIVNDAWNISGTLKAQLRPVPQIGYKGDATEMEFAIGQDPATHKSGMLFNFAHNDKSRVALRAEGTNQNGLTDLSILSTSSSLLSLIAAVAEGNTIDDLVLTLNDDLTTTVKVSDCEKMMQLQHEMAKARRKYADEATIDNYTQQLNQLISASMTCKGLNQDIPMKLVTSKLGVDYWAMPALNFADEKGNTPLTELLDAESIAYGINIIDHAVDPMQGSILVVRQLVQIVQKLQSAYLQAKPAE